MNYYEMLEIREDASPEVIKMAYKALSRKYHPDVYNGSDPDITEIMKKINEAYEVLSDSKSRMAYDAELRYQRINNENASSQEQSNESNAKADSAFPDLPLNYFKFYNNVFLILIGVSLLYNIATYWRDGSMADALSSSWPFYFSAFLAGAILVDFVILGVVIYLVFSLRKFKKLSLPINRILIVAFPVLQAFRFIGGNDGMSDKGLTILIGIVYCLIYVIPNLLYFEKRKHLFDSRLSVIESIYSDDEDKRNSARVRANKRIVLGTVLSILILLATTQAYYTAVESVYEYYGLLYSGDNLETETTETNPSLRMTKYEHYNQLIQLLGYGDRKEFVQGISDDLGMNVSALTIEEQYDLLAEEYLLTDTYENCFGLINPYSNNIIDSFEEYQAYIYSYVSEYISEYGKL